MIQQNPAKIKKRGKKSYWLRNTVLGVTRSQSKYRIYHLYVWLQLLSTVAAAVLLCAATYWSISWLLASRTLSSSFCCSTTAAWSCSSCLSCTCSTQEVGQEVRQEVRRHTGPVQRAGAGLWDALRWIPKLSPACVCQHCCLRPVCTGRCCCELL